MARILHIINHLGKGGAEVLLLDVLKYANHKEFEYHILQPYGRSDMDSQAEELGVQLHFLNGDEKSGRMKLLGEGIEKIKSLKPDLINTHTRFSDMIGLYGGKVAGVKKRMMTAHSSGMYFLDSKPLSQGVVEYFVVRYACHFAAVSNSVREYLMKYGNIRDDRITVIYNGIDTQRNQGKVVSSKTGFRERIGLASSDYVVTSVGRLIPEKGFNHLIREFKIFSGKNTNAKLVICGIGPCADELKKQVNSLGIGNRIVFLDNKQDLPELFNASDCFVLSSRKEGFGLVLLEAMMSGLPVIGSNAGGIPEIVSNEVDGLIFNLRISGDLAHALDRLYSDKNLSTFLANAGRKKALEQFNVSVTSKKYEELYRTLLGLN
jgi:glycosyltransferase involved in cell wall biosynthesis